jgi:hypothetical protein
MGWLRSKLTREQRVEGKVNALFSVLMNDHDFEFTYSERVQITQQFKSKVEESLIQEGILLEQQQSELQLTVARLRAALNTLQDG